MKVISVCVCVDVSLEMNVCYGYVWRTFSNKHLKKTVNDNKYVSCKTLCIGVQMLMYIIHIYLCLAANERFCKVEMIDYVAWISWRFFVLSLPWFSSSFLLFTWVGHAILSHFLIQYRVLVTTIWWCGLVCIGEHTVDIVASVFMSAI